MTSYVERDIIPAVFSALRNMPVVVITGMRQVGKSTLLREQPQLAARHYITLDDFAQLEAARENPDFLLNSGERLSIDEAQKCPELLTAIKRDVDRKRRAGRYLLSGSANFSLLKEITESLAGRAIYLDLLPFSRREISGSTKREPFLVNFTKSLKIPRGIDIDPIKPKEISQGGLPVVCLGLVKDKGIWFKGYEQTYLERDLRELSQVDDLVSFRRLIHLAALRTGQLLRISELARDAGMNTKTASRYLNLMETSFIIRRLEPFLANRASRLIKSPKLYLGDSGLGCFLAGIDIAGNHPDDPLWGGLFETYIAQNIAGIIAARWPQAQLGFWNVQGRYEVDFVIEYGRDTLAIEVKWAERWSKGDLAGLRAFLENTPRCRAAILGYNGTDAVQLDERLWAIPLGLLLS
jgi:hypothetical protein